MNYTAINIQGNIISSEILEKIRTEDIKYQQAGDFGLDKKTSVRDEIGLAWAAARAHWTAFQLRVNRLKEGESGAGETRNSWMIPLLRELGYDVEKATAYIHPDTQKSYAISHRAANRENFPIHIMGINDSLDKRRERSGPRLSPHALTQEYLNTTDPLYALVTNGKYLRLLRDATRLVRLSYIEFDLSRIMEDELYVEFAILVRLLHATRMPVDLESVEESYIEYYHQESLSTGSRIREKLSIAVEKSIKTLANGFLSHPENTSLRERIHQGEITSSDFYLYQLRLIYRFLFLIVTEERNLIYPHIVGSNTPSRPSPKGGGDLSKLRKIYYEHYSIERLRKLSRKLLFVDGRKHDLWEGLINTFLLFEKGQYGEKLGIKPFGSGLFSSDALSILPKCMLDNKSLLRVIGWLTQFENDQRQLVDVNYSDLDVEEFGSVYEGLLEYDAQFVEYDGKPNFEFVEGTGRSTSGSHYTPEELVKPLIKHSLEYIIEDKLKESDKEKALLSITVCDVACGSGHILLSAARRIAFDLAKVRTHEDQPSPLAIREAIRDVIKNCIYGVDKNPLAVELCKVALWLESHNPGEPLGFLDHRIKCGDSIVGLAHIEELQNGIANEAYKTLPGDEKEITSAFLRRNKNERKTAGQIAIDFDGIVKTKMTTIVDAFSHFNSLPERDPGEIQKKAEEYTRLINSRNWQKLREIANLMVAQFFIPKTIQNKESLVTEAYYQEYLSGTKGIPGQAYGKSESIAQEKRFFHWFLEFPEVFTQGGFDCILGNPPFLGGKKISSAFGDEYYSYVKNQFPEKGSSDFVGYFFRKINILISKKRFQALIATNTICQGDTREVSLEKLINQENTIVFGVKTKQWPGEAGVAVSLLSIFKGPWNREVFLNGEKVKIINSYLEPESNAIKPFELLENKNISFQGTLVLGIGFILDKEEAKYLIEKNNKNSEVIVEYINGNDLNSNFDQSASRYIIYFRQWPEEYCIKNYPECYKILYARVKPQRDKIIAKGKQIHTFNFWEFWDIREYLYNSIKGKKKILLSSRISKYINHSFIETDKIFDVATNVVNRDDYYSFAFLQSTIHIEWGWRNGSTLESRIRYINRDCIDTFPIIRKVTENITKSLDEIGEKYNEHRKELMFRTKLGLTKTYNLFHCKEFKKVTTEEYCLDDKIFVKLVGKEALQFRKHLIKTRGTISFNDVAERILKLRELQIVLDQAVLEAYSWSDIQLRHDFYEVDYLPENDRIRFTIHPDARREVLKRLLELNHQIHDEEVKAGLREKKSSSKKNNKKYLSSKSEAGSVQESEEEYGGLFGGKLSKQ